LRIEISKADGSVATLDLAFEVLTETAMADVLIALNSQLVAQGGDGALVRIASSGDKLNFFLTDGVGRFVTIKPSPGDTPEEAAANQAAVTKLGINEDLSGFVATPKTIDTLTSESESTIIMAMGGTTSTKFWRRCKMDWS